jgi:hypothetical protein
MSEKSSEENSIKAYKKRFEELSDKSSPKISQIEEPKQIIEKIDPSEEELSDDLNDEIEEIHNLDQYVNAELDDSVIQDFDKNDFKNHIRRLLEGKDELISNPSDDLNLYSNLAADSKNINFPMNTAKPFHLLSNFDDDDSQRMTPPQAYLTSPIDPLISAQPNDIFVPSLPVNFAEILAGKASEKVVYFSTLNSQDKHPDIDQINNHDNDDIKHEQMLSLDEEHSSDQVIEIEKIEIEQIEEDREKVEQKDENIEEDKSDRISQE